MFTSMSNIICANFWWDLNFLIGRKRLFCALYFKGYLMVVGVNHTLSTNEM